MKKTQYIEKGIDSIKSIECIVIGVSAGGFEVLSYLMEKIPKDLSCSIVIVQHRTADNDGYLVYHLNLLSKILVKEVDDKEPIKKGVVYLAPPDYHLFIEAGETFSLSRDERVNYARPSIDVLFESAADVYAQKCLGIILTGKNHDGANGLTMISAKGGQVIVQNPHEAEAKEMPNAAISKNNDAIILTLDEIISFISN